MNKQEQSYLEQFVELTDSSGAEITKEIRREFANRIEGGMP